jgi:GNAT superfamily N-acetyltransferase
MTLRIRVLARNDWSLLKQLRLSALEDSPEHFGEVLAHAQERSDQEWAELIAAALPQSSPRATYIAELAGVAVGMAFALPDQADAAVGRLGGMWVSRDARRRGIGLALVRAVTAWATSQGMRQVRLWVVPKTAAETLYRSAGFVATGAQKAFPGDDSRLIRELGRELEGSNSCA